MYEDLIIKDYLKRLSSKEPSSGGGSASGITGAMGAGLGMMVCDITTGKKGYENVQNEIKEKYNSLHLLQKDIMDLANQDATNFDELMKAYRLDKDAKGRDDLIQDKILNASLPALKIIRNCEKIIDLQCEIADIGVASAISDTAMGAMLAFSAMEGAALTVYMNTKLMKDRERASEIENEIETALDDYRAKSKGLFDRVEKIIKGKNL